MPNPLLSPFKTSYEMPPFSQIESAHYEEGIESALAEAKTQIQKIIENSDAPSFSNTIGPFPNLNFL